MYNNSMPLVYKVMPLCGGRVLESRVHVYFLGCQVVNLVAMGNLFGC